MAANTKKAKQILIVDDNQDIRSSIKYSLVDLGCRYEFLEAGDADSAWAVLKKTIPSLILLDLMMPGTDGWAFFEQMKKEERYSQIPVIILTAKQETSDRLMGNVLAEYYISKPFDPPSLKVKIESIIGK